MHRRKSRLITRRSSWLQARIHDSGNLSYMYQIQILKTLFIREWREERSLINMQWVSDDEKHEWLPVK